MENNFFGRIQHKHDTEKNWLKATGFTPKQGEIIIYDSEDPKTAPRFKIGDGVTNVNELPFVSDGAVINISETDVTSVVVNSETNIAGSFGFNVVEGYSEEVDNVTYGYYKVDMDLTSEEDLLKAIEDFNNAMTELESNDELTEEEKLKQRQVSMYLFKTETDSHRFDAAPVYIEAIININGYWQIKTQGFNSYSASEGTIKEFVSGSYIRIINYPNIGTVNVDGYSFAAGINSKALGDASFAVGRNNISNGAYSATFGRNNTVAYNGAAFGRYNTIDGQIGTTFGQYNKITGHDGLAAGLLNLVEGTENSTFGIKNIATGEAQTVVGKANEKDDNAYFIVGNGKTDRTEGTPIERSNAFVVRKDGSAEVQGNLIVNGQNILETQSISEIVSELPEIGSKDKIYIVDKNEYVYVSKPDSKNSEIWSGKLAEGFSKGSGSEADPYIIETAEEFATMVNGKIVEYEYIAQEGADYTESYELVSSCYYFPNATAGSYKFIGSYSAAYTMSRGYYNGTEYIEIGAISDDEYTVVPEGCYLAVSGGNISDWYAIDSNGSRYSTTIIKTPIEKVLGEAYFKLDNNIYLNDVSNSKWYNNINNKPWFTGVAQEYYIKDTDGNDTEETTTFFGHIDGNGYSVYGIWYADDSTINTSHLSSLIPTAKSGATIKNLGICKSYIVSFRDESAPKDVRGQTAGFVANTITGSKPSIIFENCYIDENTYLYGGSATGCAAGFLGYAKTNSGNPNILKNCYSLVPFSHYKGQSIKCNGLIGEVWNTYFTITNCYSITKPFEGSGSSLPQGTISNVYSITGANNASMALYTKLTESELKKVDLGKAFATTNNYPRLKNFGYWEQISSAAAGSESLHIWNGSIATEFSGGDGTETAPYIIETPEQFALMVENFGGGYYYKITEDLFFNDISLDKTEWTNAEWYCKSKETTEDKSQKYYYENKTGILGTFNGYIDGNGHSIIGLYHKDTTHYSVGLIPTMGNGYIKNLAIKNSELNASNNIGGFIGRTARLGYLSSGVIDVENCYIDSDVIIKTSGNNGAGGIIGYTVSQTLNIKNCYCLSTNIISSKAAAFVGESWNSPHTIKNCYSILQPIIQDNVARKPASCENVYSTVADSRFGGIWTRVSDTNMQGLDVLNNTSKMPKLIGEYVITSTYPTLKAFVTESEAMASDAYVMAFGSYTKTNIVSSIEMEYDLVSKAIIGSYSANAIFDRGNISLTSAGDINISGTVCTSIGYQDGKTQITGVVTPVQDTDAVNKKYVDDLIASITASVTESVKAQLAEEGTW